MDKKLKVHVFFSGQVQGVGFRFTTKKIADKLGLTGFVRNLPDGKVEAVCEGKASVLDEFLKEIKNVMSDYLSHSVVVRDAATDGFSLFEIRFF